MSAQTGGQSVDISAHPWMLYAGLIVGIVLLVAGAVPKIIGPLGQTWADWTSRQRTAAAATDDADRADLLRERDYLRGVADERLAEIARRDEMIRAHAPWDWARFENAIRRGEKVDPPPPLIPHIPPPAEPPAD